MAQYDQEIQDLERRVSALEVSQYDTAQTLRWVVAKLGGIAAMQDQHTLQLERINTRLDKIEGRLDKIDSRLIRVEADLGSLRRDMPGIVADTMREVLKGNSGP